MSGIPGENTTIQCTASLSKSVSCTSIAGAAASLAASCTLYLDRQASGSTPLALSGKNHVRFEPVVVAP